ncbi:MAG: collagenase [Thermotogota bacterium]
MFNKTIVKNGDLKFNENNIEVQWKQNSELRKYNLTKILAHEFTHNMQQNANLSYTIRTTFPAKNNWKLEGHADYIARKFKNDGMLKDKIDKYRIEESNVHKGLPATKDEIGIYWFYGYYKYALIVQYLTEEKKMNFNQICELDTNINEIYLEMLTWRNNKTTANTRS